MFNYFDKITLETIKNQKDLFGSDLDKLFKQKKNRMKKVALSRVIFTGKKFLIDYNWSIKLVQSSDMLKNSPMHVIQVELLMMNEKQEEESYIIEFTEDELNEMPMIPDKDEEEENKANDDSDIRESIKQFFDCEEDMKNREPEFTGDFAAEELP